MDWEKKTYARSKEEGAAADTFNDMLLPSQTLLQTLQDSEVARKERYFSTVSAKMKAAREKLPSLGVKHAPRSDASIFTVPPPREVHSLLPDVRPEKANMEGVRKMLEQQMERHRAVWDTFVGVRDGTKQQLEEEVGSLATELKIRLESDDACIEEIMDTLKEDRVMRLTEPEVYQVWDAVAQRVPERARWIEVLGSSLEEAEERRRVAVEGQLTTMVQDMAEVAALSEGEIERILERESINLNTSILQNRRAYADFVKRLQVAEVDAERKRRQRWETALNSWRTLRSLHAMDLFNQRIKSHEFSEPPERSHLFSRIREWQSKNATRMVRHVENIPQLLPPHLSARRVASWCETSARMTEHWLKDSQTWHERLVSHDDEIDNKGWQAYAQLTQEVLDYKGYPEEEARELLDKGCGAVLRERREAALALLMQAKKFLEWQASRWRHFSGALGDWLVQLCTMFEEHKTNTSNNENNVRSTLKSRRELRNAEDAAREAALEAAIEAVRQGSNENHLDAQVANALARLDEIEEGYRSFHTAMSEIVHAFPRTVSEANERYHWLLCNMMLVKPHMPTPEWAKPPPPPPPPSPPAEATPKTPESQKPGTPNKPGLRRKGKPEPPPEPPPEPEPVPEPEPEPQPIKVFRLSDGSTFELMKDLLEELLSQSKATAQAEATAAAQEAAAAAAAERAAQAEEEAAEAAAAEAAAPAPQQQQQQPGRPGPGAKQRSLKPSPSTTKRPGTNASRKEIDHTAIAEESEAAPPPPPPVLVEPEVRTSPLSSSGSPHLRSVVLPLPRFREVLEQMQVGMLKEMVEFSVRTMTTAEEWSAEREGQLTEELDAHLRAHRPRAGRIEEETRLARSVELVAQRRKVEGHLRAQSKAVKAQAAQFEEWMSALKADMSKKIARLRGYDAFLRQALSGKGIDIRKREAEALRARIERELAAKQSELEHLVALSCQQIIHANEAFASSELRTFQEGGAYSNENVQTYSASIGAIDAHMRATKETETAGLQSLRSQLTQEADSALEYVSSLLPSFHEDMSLIEHLDELLEAARKKARTELTRNSEAAAAINTELDKLEAVLAPTPPPPRSPGLESSPHKGTRGQSGGISPRPSISTGGLTPRQSVFSMQGDASTGTSRDFSRRNAGGGVTFAARSSDFGTGANLGPRASVSMGNEDERGGAGGYGGGHTHTGHGSPTGGYNRRSRHMPPLVQCRVILESLASLRGMLLRQAKTLDFLRSTGMTIEPVELTIEAAPTRKGRHEPDESDEDAKAGMGAKGVAFRPGARRAGEAAESAAAAAAAASKKKGADGGAGKGGSVGRGGKGSGAEQDSRAGTPGYGAEGGPTLAEDIEAVIDGCKRDTEARAREYHAALYPDAGKTPKKPQPRAKKGEPVDDTPQPIRPIRYPNRIPPTLDLLLSQTDNVLNALREQLQQHLLVGVKELRTQVIRAYRLAEHAPAVAMAALTAHELQAALEAQAEIRRRYGSKQAALLSQIEDQRHTLHPNMILPSGRGQLNHLKDREQTRSEVFKDMLTAYAREGVQGVEAQGPVIQQRLVHLVSLMLKLLDNFLMPDDVPPIKSDSTDDWVYALPGRKDDKQLHRLALANAEAEGVPEVINEKDPKARKSAPGKKTPPSPKGKDTDKKGSEESVPRPFGLLTWALPCGNLDLGSLGWTNEPDSGLPQVHMKEGKEAPSKAEGVQKAKTGAKPSTERARASPTAEPSTVALSGLDTPCHRAGIRAYRASLQQVEAALCNALQGLRNEMLVWSRDEQLWQQTWATLISQVEGL